MTDSTIPFLSGTRRERVVVALASPMLGLVCAWCFLTAHAVLSDTSSATPRARLVLNVFHILAAELFAGACLLLVLAFVWAVFRPQWTVRLLTALSHHVWRAVCLVLFAFLLTALVGSWIDHMANKSVEPTGGSRSGQSEFLSRWRLPPVAHARR